MAMSQQPPVLSSAQIPHVQPGGLTAWCPALNVLALGPGGDQQGPGAAEITIVEANNLAEHCTLELPFSGASLHGTEMLAPLCSACAQAARTN